VGNLNQSSQHDEKPFDAKPRNVDMVGRRGRRRPVVSESLDTGSYPHCNTYSCSDEAIFYMCCKASLYGSQSLTAYVRHYTTPYIRSHASQGTQPYGNDAIYISYR